MRTCAMIVSWLATITQASAVSLAHAAGEQSEQTLSTTTQGSGVSIDGVAQSLALPAIPIYDSPSIGESHGTAFTDFHWVFQERDRFGVISFITMAGCQAGSHLTGLDIGLRNRQTRTPVAETHVIHGTMGDVKNQFQFLMGVDEYIAQVEVSTYRFKRRFTRRTRVGWVRFTTSDDRKFSCGGRGNDDPYASYTHPNHAFSFFSGSAGDGIDALQAHWVPIDKYQYHHS